MWYLAFIKNVVGSIKCKIQWIILYTVQLEDVINRIKRENKQGQIERKYNLLTKQNLSREILKNSFHQNKIYQKCLLKVVNTMHAIFSVDYKQIQIKTHSVVSNCMKLRPANINRSYNNQHLLNVGTTALHQQQWWFWNISLCFQSELYTLIAAQSYQKHQILNLITNTYS